MLAAAGPEPAAQPSEDGGRAGSAGLAIGGGAALIAAAAVRSRGAAARPIGSTSKRSSASSGSTPRSAGAPSPTGSRLADRRRQMTAAYALRLAGGPGEAGQSLLPMSAEPASERVAPLPRSRSLDRRREGALVRDAQRGSTEALEELFRRHWRRAHRAAYLVVGDPAAAEDIAQESFLAAIRALDRFDRRRPFGPWLHRITVNRAIDFARARALRAESALSAGAARRRPRAGRRSRTGCWTALGDLGPEHRAVVVLRYVLEYSPGEIAAILELPRGTVNSRLRRGLDRLRPALDDEEGVVSARPRAGPRACARSACPASAEAEDRARGRWSAPPTTSGRRSKRPTARSPVRVGRGRRRGAARDRAQPGGCQGGRRDRGRLRDR